MWTRTRPPRSTSSLSRAYTTTTLGERTCSGHGEDPDACDVHPPEPSPRPPASVGVPLPTGSDPHRASIQIKFCCTNNPSDFTIRHSSRDVLPGPAWGLDDGPYDVGRDAKDGGPEPAIDARGELPWRRGVPPSTPPLVLQQLCLHLSFVPSIVTP
jgi:hypothetical protein